MSGFQPEILNPSEQSGLTGERADGFEQDDTKGRLSDRNGDSISVCHISDNQFFYGQFLDSIDKWRYDSVCNISF